jgi:hypothetical protein
MTDLDTPFPPPPVGDPEQLRTAADGFMRMVAELNGLAPYVRGVAHNLVDAAWRGEASLGFIAYCDSIQHSLGQAAQVAGMFAGACLRWAEELEPLPGTYAWAYDEYEAARREIATTQAYLGLHDGDARLALAARISAAEARAERAVECAWTVWRAADEAATTAGGAFGRIPPVTLGATGVDLSALDLPVDLAGSGFDGLEASGHGIAGGGRIGDALTIADGVVAGNERWREDSDNPRLDQLDRVTRAVVEGGVTGWVSGLAGAGASGGVAWYLAPTGPPGWVVGGLAAAAGFLVGEITEHVADDAFKRILDGGPVEPPVGPPAGPIPPANLNYPPALAEPTGSPQYQEAVRTVRAGPPPPAPLPQPRLPDP